jgi:hypothetical protein
LKIDGVPGGAGFFRRAGRFDTEMLCAFQINGIWREKARRLDIPAIFKPALVYILKVYHRAAAIASRNSPVSPSKSP